jgi:hypothetical protein
MGCAVALGLAIAALVPIPGPDGDAVCRAYESGDRSQLREVVEGLRFSDMTLLERARERMTPIPPDLECLLATFAARSELPRFCRRMLPSTPTERNLRDLQFRRAFLESQIACLEQARAALQGSE